MNEYTTYDFTNTIIISIEDLKETLTNSPYGDIKILKGLGALIEVKSLIEDLEEFRAFIFEKVNLIINKDDELNKKIKTLLKDYLFNGHGHEKLTKQGEQNQIDLNQIFGEKILRYLDITSIYEKKQDPVFKNKFKYILKEAYCDSSKQFKLYYSLYDDEIYFTKEELLTTLNELDNHLGNVDDFNRRDCNMKCNILKIKIYLDNFEN